MCSTTSCREFNIYLILDGEPDLLQLPLLQQGSQSSQHITEVLRELGVDTHVHRDIVLPPSLKQH